MDFNQASTYPSMNKKQVNKRNKKEIAPSNKIRNSGRVKGFTMH